MIIKTLELSCDHDAPDVCDAVVEGQAGESRATPLIKAALAQPRAEALSAAARELSWDLEQPRLRDLYADLAQARR